MGKTHYDLIQRVRAASAKNKVNIDNNYGSGYSGNGGDQHMPERIARIEEKVAQIENNQNRLTSQIDSLKTATITLMLGGFGVIIALLTVATTWFIHDSNRNWEIAQESLDQIHAIELRMERNAANQPK